MRHSRTFFTSFDATATAPRRIHASLALAAAGSMDSLVFLYVVIVMGLAAEIMKMKLTWMVAVTKSKTEIFICH